jgi:N-acetylmuramic acid 6-phosphate etherase
MEDFLKKAQRFIHVKEQFCLGNLSTEGFHLKTQKLSELADKKPKEALQILKEIDIDSIKLLREKLPEVFEMYHSISKTIQKGNRIFLCGCGATGRLSLALETLYRQKVGGVNVISFMAGGDVALIKSIESFEDRVSYGARQLRELGFKDGDLLISCTEGGETPFVIGATEESTKISSNNPYFLFCNSIDELLPIQRSKNVIDNDDIRKMSIATGPMALSGSTRMQASTVLMFAVGLALLHKYDSFEDLADEYQRNLEVFNSIDYTQMENLIVEESNIYKSDEYLLYKCPSSLGISILTDTTERSPTFSLAPFENDLDTNSIKSLCYLCLEDTRTSANAWKAMLGRRPRVLDWIEFDGEIGLERIYGFDISKKAQKERKERLDSNQHVFQISQTNGTVSFQLNENLSTFEIGHQSILTLHLVLKVLLNAHSTLVMGRLGRYEGNVMTWVRPSNNKLIDRSVRYIQQILKVNKINPDYDDIVYECFHTMESINENDSLVMEVVRKFRNQT